MDMKRWSFLLLLVLLISGTAWAGVRLDLDGGYVSGSSASIEATTEGETGNAMSFTALGTATTQTDSQVAVLTLSHESVETLEPVTLDASGSQPGAGEIILYEWDLNGDGVFDESSTQGILTHAYTEDGTVFIQVRITDDLGESALSDVVQLDVVNRQPLARFSVNPGSSIEGSAVEFIDSSHDDDGLIASWSWEFGDGATSSESSPLHTYNAAGVFSATLSVADDDGAWSEIHVFEVEILNQAPQAEFTLDQSILGAGIPLILIDESFDPSPDGGIVHVAWDFGDGVYQAGGPSADSVYSHTYTLSGTYTITLYVIDDDGAMDRSQITVRIP